MRFLKWVLIILVLLTIVGGGVAWLATKLLRATRPDTNQPTSVRVEKAARRQLVETVSAPGEIQPKTRVQISARVAARITALPFEEGQDVKKDDLLVQLDAKDLQAALSAARARQKGQLAELEVAKERVESQKYQVDAARFTLEEAKRQLKREMELADYAVRKDVEAAQTRVAELTAQLTASEKALHADRINLTVLQHSQEAVKAEVERAEEALSYTVMRSPINGTVTRIEGEVGELVVTGTLNTPGTVVMTVADLSKMQVVAQVSENAIVRVRQGQKASVRTLAYPGVIFDGVVETVALANDARNGGGGGRNNLQTDESRFFEVKIAIDTGGRRVQSGLTADVDIETDRHDNALTVPSQAVLGRPVESLPKEMRDRPEVDKTKSYATVVFRPINGKAVLTPVKVGASDLTHTMILAGLSESDGVITGPYRILDGLTDGQNVTAEDVASTQPAATTAPSK